MKNEQFLMPYNGKPVAVTVLDTNFYMVQVTYKPVRLRLINNHNGMEEWIDEDTRQATPLTNELGALITTHLCAV